MAIELLTERHGDQIAGVLGCWDRMLIFGTLPKICFAGGMTSFLFERNIRIFDYPRFAEPFRNRIRENADWITVVAYLDDVALDAMVDALTIDHKKWICLSESRSAPIRFWRS